MDASPDLPRQSRIPVFNMPGIVTGSIALLLAIHVVRAVLPETWDWRAIIDLAFIPARWTAAFDPARIPEIVEAAAQAAGSAEVSEARQDFARAIVADRAAMPWTLASYGLLHGSWMHVAFNAIWLAAFGTPVARHFGAWRYAVLAVVGIVAGALLHLWLDPLSTMPLVGASAGISALMGAATRFVFQPPPDYASAMAWQLPPRPAVQSLSELARNRTAVIFIGIWFATNLVFGLLSEPLGAGEGPIAWDAHLGGFYAGFFLLPLLVPNSRSA